MAKRIIQGLTLLLVPTALIFGACSDDGTTTPLQQTF